MSEISVSRTALDEAAAWHLRLLDATPDCPDHDAFRDWLAENGENRQALDLLSTTWVVVDRYADSEPILKRRVKALEHLYYRGERRRSPSNRLRPSTGALAMMASVILIIAAWTALPATHVFGGRNVASLDRPTLITLEDGSRVSLDARSRIRVLFTRDRRDVILEQGQARFQVAKDPHRPFAVDTGSRYVVATGTDFNIDRSAGAVTTTLIEGRVFVARQKGFFKRLVSREPWEEEVPMRAGQQIMQIAGTDKLVIAEGNIEAATSWISGKIVFDQTPLSEAAMRIGRYTPHEIKVGSKSIEQLRISGVFDTGDADTFIQAVTALWPVDAIRERNGNIILVAQHAP